MLAFHPMILSPNLVGGVVPGLEISTWARDCFSPGWRFYTEIGSTRLPSPFCRTSVTIPCTQLHVLNQKRNTQHYAVYTCAIGSCMPSHRLWRLYAPLVLPFTGETNCRYGTGRALSSSKLLRDCTVHLLSPSCDHFNF